MYFITTIFPLFVLIATASGANEGCTIRKYSEINRVTKNCRDIKVSNLQVPANSTLNLNLNSGTNLVFEGRIRFDYAEWHGPLVKIVGDSLTVRGTSDSLFDGQGELYWDSFGGNGGITKPKFIKIEVTNSTFEYINVKNCPVHCISINAENSEFNQWSIDVSDGDKNNFTGHNTDGFDVKGTNLKFKNNVVKNQDDCLVVNRGNSILVSNMSCYGGHGLSISVGFSGNDFKANTVENIVFENSLVHRSPNGIHLKTHADAGQGIVNNIIFRNIVVEKITNFGINIQQDYINGQSTGIPGNNIPIKDLILENINGYMESFNDSPTLETRILCGKESCLNWKFSGINITGALNGTSCNYQPEGYSC